MPPEGEQQQQNQQQQQQNNQPWHAGLDAEFLGHAQNKGWDMTDPAKAFAGAVKQARELERHFGVPPEQLIRMPKPDAKPEAIKEFRMKLGMPAEAKDYDFSGIKGADGNDMAAPLADALRTVLHSAGTPKDAAAAIAAAVQKHMDDSKTAADTVSNAKLAEQKAKLKADWKNNYDFNHLKAMEGARRLGINPEAVKALENVIGYDGVMEAMRKIGSATSEDTFIERGAGGDGGVPHTREGAIARKEELMKDDDWVGRFLKGSTAEVNEMTALNTMIDGDS